MATSIVKKKIFASSLRTLLEKQELIKISVTDICAVHDVSRKSFYYHFRDKYDLVEWMFLSECGNELKEHQDPIFWDYFRKLAIYLHANRKLYIQAFQLPGYDTFRTVLVKFMADLFPYYVQEYFNTNEEFRTNVERQQACIDFLAVDFVATLENWITNYPKTDIDELIKLVRFDKIIDSLDRVHS